MTVHSVEKIGGTSMSRFDELIDHLFKENGKPVYNRIFVVSAYGGITDMLLEHKHSGEPGVYALFSAGEDEDAWQHRLDEVCSAMKAINAKFFTADELLGVANNFVDERIEDARRCLSDVRRVCTFGPFEISQYLTRVRELLSSIGEAHSAHNASLLLQENGVMSRFVDVTGWRDIKRTSLTMRLRQALDTVDPGTEVPVFTGYVQCTEGLVSRYARGYTELTMAKLCELTKPGEAIIHKEYHLSSGDPKLVTSAEVYPIGRTNYDVADQLANLGMEAIHPSAAGILRKSGIPLRVKHAFEPAHDGTLIDSEYRSEQPMVEIIAGRRGLTAIEIFDQDMIGEQLSYESQIIEILKNLSVKPVGKDLNANSIVLYLPITLSTATRVAERVRKAFPNAEVSSKRVAFVCAVGSDIDTPGILATCARALMQDGVSILSSSSPLRGVDARFVVLEDRYTTAVNALHRAAIATQPDQADAA